jgi:putative aldouronate transport system permease protein
MASVNTAGSMQKIAKKGFWPELFRNMRTQKELWLISLPIIIWVVLFSYVPMWGVSIAFLDFRPGRSVMDSPFVGLQHFQWFFSQPIFMRLLRNTLVMSLLGMTVGFSVPIIFSVLLNEIHIKKIKKGLQTVSYLPHFISWVAAGAMIRSILATEGAFNDFLLTVGLIDTGIPWLSQGNLYWAIFTLANIWKGMGWSSIIYLAAMTGVDHSLLEACAIDGGGRARMVWNILLPTIIPTIVLLWIMGIGGILTAGFEQHLILGTPLTQGYWDVFDTYVFRFGIQNGNFSIATAVGLWRSIIGFILVLLTNWFCKRRLNIALI